MRSINLKNQGGRQMEMMIFIALFGFFMAFAVPVICKHFGLSPMVGLGIGVGGFIGFFLLIGFFYTLWARIEAFRYGRRFPLHQAVKRGDTKAVKGLLSDLDRFDCYHETALSLAVQGGHLEIAGLLLEAGADPSLSMKKNYTLLHYACRQPKALQFAKALLDHGACVDAKGLSGDTPLMWVKNSPAVIELLLDRGADINATNDLGRTALHHLIPFDKDIGFIRTLIARGAEVNARDKEGMTPLHHYAGVSLGKVVCDLLIQEGADPLSLDDEGSRPLHYAAVRGHLDTVKLLLEKGAEVNGANKNGETPLHIACCLASKEVVAYLLDHGAWAGIRDCKGRLPLDFARKHNREELVELLESVSENVASE